MMQESHGGQALSNKGSTGHAMLNSFQGPKLQVSGGRKICSLEESEETESPEAKPSKTD